MIDVVTPDDLINPVCQSRGDERMEGISASPNLWGKVVRSEESGTSTEMETDNRDPTGL